MNSEILIPFNGPLIRAGFVRRIKRFTIEAETDGGILSAHTNNTGSMMGLLRPGTEVFLSPASDPRRKLKYTLECLDFHGAWVGVNTLIPNRMLRCAWERSALPEVAGYDVFKSEASVGQSRLDGLFTRNGGRDAQDQLWVECKNVTLVEDQVARFPDASTERGRKHLRELMSLSETGARVALFFLVQRPDAHCFGPADFIDPEYADLLFKAENAGVEIWPYVADINQAGISLGRRLSVTSG